MQAFSKNHTRQPRFLCSPSDWVSPARGRLQKEPRNDTGYSAFFAPTSKPSESIKITLN